MSKDKDFDEIIESIDETCRDIRGHVADRNLFVSLMSLTTVAQSLCMEHNRDCDDDVLSKMEAKLVEIGVMLAHVLRLRFGDDILSMANEKLDELTPGERAEYDQISARLDDIRKG